MNFSEMGSDEGVNMEMHFNMAMDHIGAEVVSRTNQNSVGRFQKADPVCNRAFALGGAEDNALNIMLPATGKPVGPDRLHKLPETTLVDRIAICSIPNLHPRVLQTPCNFSYLLIHPSSRSTHNSHF